MGFSAALCGVLLVVIFIIISRKSEIIGMRPKDYPPGPWTLPLIGNLHQMPRSDFHLQLQKWAQKYGPIFSLKLGSQTLVVLSGPDVVKDLLDKRSNVYSGRPAVFIREFGDDLNILMRTNDETWRRQRKMYHVQLNVNVADKYIPYQDFESKELLWDLLLSPENFNLHLKRFTTSLASTMVYGWRTTSVDLPQVKSLFEWIEGYAVAASQMQIMDWYPILRPIFRRLPSKISGIQDEIIRLKNIEEHLWFSLMQDAQDRMKEGEMNEKYVGRKRSATPKEIAFNAGHAWAGATDTTYNTLQGFLKAMILFPDVQREAQKEIDSVVDKDRLPEWTDLANLPYIQSCVKETLRWSPTTITGGMPHCVAKDDIYMGYRIPAGASILQNVWTLNSRVRSPREFDPTRHFEDRLSSQESAVQADSNKRDHFTFGAGRRICPGLHVADRSLFITISRLLWAFDITPEMDASGQPVPTERDAMTPGFIVAPMPYKCTIRPRDEMRAKIIDSIWKSASESLDENDNYNGHLHM